MNDQRIGNLTLPWRRRGAKHFTAPQYHHVHTLLKIFIITSLLVHSIATTDAFAKRQVNVLILRDVVITPIIVEVIEDAIDKSAADDAECLIIQLSTNGGMVDATQQIIEVLLNAEIPVVVYVAPRGARAFSAGTFILIAGHIAVMAPGTTTGAAHPVALPIVPQPEGESERQREAEAIMLDKLTKALVGTAKAVAEERKRKFEWAERVILKSEALTAGEAVKCGLIDFIAEDLHDLVSKLDDRTVKVGKDTVTLRTKNARINYLEMTPKQKFLEKLSHPNMAFILLLVAMFGFLMEIYHPGAIIPAVVGSIAFLLFLYSATLLPLNWVGILLVLLSIAFFIAELFIVSHGALTAGGLVALALGGYMLVDVSNPRFWGVALRVSTPVIGITVAFFGGFISLAIWKAIQAHRRKVVTGAEGLIGRVGLAKSALNPEGVVFLDGSLWNAESVDGKVEAGAKVEVVAVEGLRLKVKRHQPQLA